MKLNLQVDNIWTHIINKDLGKEFIKAISDKMSYTVQEYAPSRKIMVNFDFTLFDKNELKYPTGLFSNLYDVLQKRDIEFNIDDLRNKPISYKKDLIIHGKILRDYQEETVSKAIKAERGIIKLATGAGKTTVGASIIARLDIKTMFLVHTVDLLEQTYNEFISMLGVEIGRVGGGYCDIRQINICTIQTLHSALGLKYEAVDSECHIKEKISPQILKRKREILDMIENCELIINDECQHSKASSYVNMMKSAKNAYYRFGLSATPYKYDSQDIILNAYSGREIISINASYLIERGFLVQPNIHFLDANKLGGYHYVRGRFDTVYKEWIVENKLRNNLISDCVERLLELNKTTLITVTHVKHGELIMEILNERLGGVNVAFIHGEVKGDKRKQLLDDIRNRDLKVLIGTSLADEGLDLPALDAVIMGGGGKSLIKSLQRVGRTLRPYPNVENNIKKEAIVIDFYDNLRYLTGQSKKRMAIYKQEPKFNIFENF